MLPKRAVAASAVAGFLLFSYAGAPAWADAPAERPPQIENETGLSGHVLGAAAPIGEARVFAYQLVERTLERVLTDAAGEFFFAGLPAGIYQIIAHKAGFEPAVVMLQRDAADAAQSVTIELEPQRARRDAAAGTTDFWSVRAAVPVDVLRELDLPQFAVVETTGDEVALAGDAPSEPAMRAEVSALTGVDEVKPSADARLSGGNVGVVGRLGDVRVVLEGDFQSLQSAAAQPGLLAVDGSTRSVSLSFETPHTGVFDLASTSNRLLTAEDGIALPVEASQYQFGWNRGVGDHGETSVRGYYIEETGLYNKGWVEPIELPFASRMLAIEGNYSHRLENANLRAGMRYRERTGSYAHRFTGDASGEYVAEYLDAFGSGDWQLNQAVLLEYGLFTTMRDGSVSLTPRGGVVLRLGQKWQTSLSVAERIADDSDPYQDEFMPVLVEESLDCGESELSCYELSFQRGEGSADNFAFGGSYRELDATLKMFFSGNFFDHSEGLFLVPGDVLPEAHASFRKRLAPQIVTRVSSSYAEGGGGVYRAVNNRVFENSVELLSTTVDTSFEATATGVFVAFHRLEQSLQPYNQIRRRMTPTTAGLERLEVVLHQNLSEIIDLPADWAIRLGLELARGASFFHSDVDPDELRRQVMTGVAVRF